MVLRKSDHRLPAAHRLRGRHAPARRAPTVAAMAGATTAQPICTTPDAYGDTACAERRSRSSATSFLRPRSPAVARCPAPACHDPNNHYAPANDRAVQLGGPHLDQPGIRAVPSPRLQDVDAFILRRRGKCCRRGGRGGADDARRPVARSPMLQWPLTGPH